MATASHPAVPTHVSEPGAGSMSLVREGDAPPAPNAHPPSIGTMAAQLGAAAARAVVDHAISSKPATGGGDKQPSQPTLLPAWLSLLLALGGATGGLGVGLAAALGLQGGAEVKAVKADLATFKIEIKATIESDRAQLHKNDAALGKWAVDMSRDVSAGLVSLDSMLRPMAKAQGIDTDSIAKPAIAGPDVTVRALALQAEAEGL